MRSPPADGRRIFGPLAAGSADPTRSGQIAMKSRRLPAGGTLFSLRDRRAIRLQLGEVDGLYEMRVKPGIDRTLTVIALAPTRQGNQPQPLAPGLPADLRCEFEAVHLWHANVEQRNVGAEFGERRERTLTVKGHAHLMAFDTQQHFETFAGVAIVIGEKNTQGRVAGAWRPQLPPASVELPPPHLRTVRVVAAP